MFCYAYGVESIAIKCNDCDNIVYLYISDICDIDLLAQYIPQDKDKFEILKTNFNKINKKHNNLILEINKLEKENNILRNRYTRFDIMDI